VSDVHADIRRAVSTSKQSPVLGYGSSESFDGSSGLP
jgi:hypothetical protein